MTPTLILMILDTDNYTVTTLMTTDNSVDFDDFVTLTTPMILMTDKFMTQMTLSDLMTLMTDQILTPM